MKLAKCNAGHFYDADKYPECPYCNTALQKDAGIVSVAAGEDKPAEAEKALPAGPVTGWLVVMDGPAAGRDLRLGQGRNFIGVDAQGTPVLLSADAPLSARQAVLVYDPEASAFTLLPGSSSELCYLAGSALLTPQELAADAELKIGGAVLRFVPFCGAFRWSQHHAKQKPAKTETPAAEKSVKAEKTEKNAPQAKKPAQK